MRGAQRSGGEDRSSEELRTLLMLAGTRLARDGDPERFLSWMAEHGPSIAPSIARQVDPSAGTVGQAFRSIGRMVFEATPLPTNAWAPRSLPVPGRNEACHCGSGEKYKHCCAVLAEVPQPKQPNMLAWVLAAMPLKCFAELPGSRVSIDAVHATAVEWADAGDVKRAAALLAPWFAGTGKLGARLGPLFDLLADLHDRLGAPRRKLNLVSSVIARGDDALQAEGWMRRCAILSDRGDGSGARDAFIAAQRLDPDNPNLALLEITVLAATGEHQEARSRAEFWLRRLQRTHRGDPAIGPLLDLLRRTIEDPARALIDSSRGQEPAFDRLIELLDSAEPVRSLYRLIPDGSGSAGPLAAEPALARAEKLWRKRFPGPKPPSVALAVDMSAAWKHADDWLDLLEATPVLWNSFDVLDDLAAAADGLDRFGFDTELLLPLLDRAARLIETVRAGNRVEGLRLEWRRLENRPALRLMARSAVIALQSADIQRAIGHLEPLVFELNPEDNHGFRNELSRCYLLQRRPQDVLRLSRCYPDDVGELAFDRALALFMLGQHADALGALQWAHRLLPRVLPMLCRNSARPPAGLQADQVTVGGADEAWFYRESRREFWLREDALDFARGVSR